MGLRYARARGRIAAWIFALSFSSTAAWAIPITSVPGAPDPNSFLPDSLGNAAVKAFGLGNDHRAYAPASVLDSLVGLDVGISVSLSKVPDDLVTSLSELGSTTGGQSSGSLSGTSMIAQLGIPDIRLIVHKGFGDRVDLGFSMLPNLSMISILAGNAMTGFDAKVIIYKPDEGPVWAIRTSFNMTWISLPVDPAITIYANTITPQVLVSKRLNFAEPYMGAGFQYTWGNISMSYQPTISGLPPGVTIDPITATKNGSAVGVVTFGGIAFKIPVIAQKITLEGAYNSGGTSYIGTKIGFSF